VQSYQQFNDQLKGIETLFKTQFANMAKEFEKASEKLEETQETIIHRLNLNKERLYKKFYQVNKKLNHMKESIKKEFLKPQPKPNLTQPLKAVKKPLPMQSANSIKIPIQKNNSGKSNAVKPQLPLQPRRPYPHPYNTRNSVAMSEAKKPTEGQIMDIEPNSAPINSTSSEQVRNMIDDIINMPTQKYMPTDPNLQIHKN